jgi:hypothetical protein
MSDNRLSVLVKFGLTEEWYKFFSVPRIGDKFISNKGIAYRIVDVTWDSHKSWDGISGYPYIDVELIPVISNY